MRFGLLSQIGDIESELPSILRRYSLGKCEGREHEIISFSLVGRNLSKIMDVVPHNQLSVRPYREILTSRGLIETLRFLDLSIEDLPLDKPEDRTKLEQKVCYSIPALKLDRTLREHRELPADIIKPLRHTQRECWRRYGMKPPALSAGLYSQLQEIFESDVESFEELTGIRMPESKISVTEQAG